MGQHLLVAGEVKITKTELPMDIMIAQEDHRDVGPLVFNHDVRALRIDTTYPREGDYPGKLTAHSIPCNQSYGIELYEIRGR